LFVVATAVVAMLWSSSAMATITQGDFSIYGFGQTRWSGRWGEAGAKGNSVAATPGFPIGVLGGTARIFDTPGSASSVSGGSFDFNRWDLVQARTLGDLRPNYHVVKNYNLFGRLDTLVLKDADVFAFYRPWYDAFGDFKKQGVAPPGRQWPDYTQNERQQRFFRNDLREYFAQLNFTDNFSMRVGKQQVIWSEADALSGTDVINTSDLTYHWTHFESPENLRKNVQMVKWNYLLPDYFQTANNEIEAFWIPGDYQGSGVKAVTDDSRNPYSARVHTIPGTVCYNQFGVPFRSETLAENCAKRLQRITFAPVVHAYMDRTTFTAAGSQTIKTVDNSEFGVRLSSLLPIGNGLQMSAIYMYLARLNATEVDITTSRRQAALNAGLPASTAGFAAQPGVFLFPGAFAYGATPGGFPKWGTISVNLSNNARRRHFFILTGTYYDKDLTDVVYRYDFSYAPAVGIALSNPLTKGLDTRVGVRDRSGVDYTNLARFIVAADRPTYIPYLSKQHTFFVAQYTNTWFPGRPSNAVPNIAATAGKTRELSNLGFVSAVNWLWNGQWVTTNTVAWDIDNNVGFLGSTNTYRYSRNIIFGLNSVWYMGRSGRYTDPFVFSGNQRINEIEVSVTYEI